MSPSIELSCENNILDIGDALVADVISTILKVIPLRKLFKCTYVNTVMQSY